MTPSTLSFVFLVLILFISYLRYLYYRSNMKARQEQTLFLLDKFASPQELTAFLNSAEGKQLLQLLGWNDGNRNLKALALTFQIISIFLLILAFVIFVFGIFETDPQHVKQGWSLAFLMAMLGGGSFVVHRLIRKQMAS